MGLEEPQVLIEFASYLREQIGGDGVVQIARFLNRLAQCIGMVRHVMHKELQHGRTTGSSQVRFLEIRFRRHFPRCAIRDTAQRGDALRDRIGLFFEMGRDRIEQFVELNKMQPLHVPVGPFHLGAQVRAIRETLFSNAMSA